MKVTHLFIAAALVLTAAAGYAQNRSLAVGTAKPVVDGVVKGGEYTLQKDFGQMRLCLSRTKDTLFIAAVGNTKGWIAVGLNSALMDGSTIFMGFIGEDGKEQFKVQAGSGHMHSDPKDQAVSDSVTSYAIKEAEGKTTLELALKAAAYIRSGQEALDTIYAIGAQQSFSPYHTFRGSVKVSLAQ